ncbi:MAG TPA: hypothetical protein VE398_20170 [Acidobacteriota bacterium]|nr:hypothetical protein [Acidobacteriota bacterium]
MREFLWKVPSRYSRWTAFVLSLVILSLIGVGDYLTGTEIDFTLFYLIPVVFLTWKFHIRVGTMTSILCALVWALVDHFGRTDLHLVPALWNITIKFGVFVIFAYALSLLHDRTTEERRLNSELRAALLEVKRLSGLLPICAWCRKIRDERDTWVSLESYVVNHSEADFTHGICPDCAAKVKQGA